jgi:hypothetical protein
VPCSSISGSAPSSAAIVVIMIGRKRSKLAWRIAVVSAVELANNPAKNSEADRLAADQHELPLVEEHPCSSVLRSAVCA